MTRIVLAICGERDERGWLLKRYSYLDDLHEKERVRDGNYARYLVSRLAPSEEGSGWIVDERPDAKDSRFFDIYIDIQDYGRNTAHYRADYFKYAGCPAAAITEGMEIYAAVRKYGIRPTEKMLERNRVAKRNIAKGSDDGIQTVRETPKCRFECGKTYLGKFVDKYGHLTTVEAHIDGVIDGRVVVTIPGRRSGFIAQVMKSDDGTEYFNTKYAPCPIRANNRKE